MINFVPFSNMAFNSWCVGEKSRNKSQVTFYFFFFLKEVKLPSIDTKLLKSAERYQRLIRNKKN